MLRHAKGTPPVSSIQHAAAAAAPASSMAFQRRLQEADKGSVPAKGKRDIQSCPPGSEPFHPEILKFLARPLEASALLSLDLPGRGTSTPVKGSASCPRLKLLHTAKPRSVFLRKPHAHIVSTRFTHSSAPPRVQESGR